MKFTYSKSSLSSERSTRQGHKQKSPRPQLLQLLWCHLCWDHLECKINHAWIDVKETGRWRHSTGKVKKSSCLQPYRKRGSLHASKACSANTLLGHDSKLNKNINKTMFGKTFQFQKVLWSKNNMCGILLHSFGDAIICKITRLEAIFEVQGAQAFYYHPSPHPKLYFKFFYIIICVNFTNDGKFIQPWRQPMTLFSIKFNVRNTLGFIGAWMGKCMYVYAITYRPLNCHSINLKWIQFPQSFFLLLLSNLSSNLIQLDFLNPNLKSLPDYQLVRFPPPLPDTDSLAQELDY